MPTLITHSMIGVAAGQELMPRPLDRRFWLAAVICPLLPDADVIGLYLGVPYDHFFGHRGFFHSPFFACLLSVFLVCVVFREQRIFSKPWWLFVGFFSLITASHGILDAFTSGGLGIALLSPFDSTRYFFPWTPIIVSPIGIRYMFSTWGLAVLVSEVRYIWLPVGVFFLLMRLVRRKREGKTSFQE
jgi:inner membrane protein